MTTKQYQSLLLPQVRETFTNLEVENEWPAFTGALYKYSPRVDIAVGPFSVTPGQNQIMIYNRLVRDRGINLFLRRAFEFHIQNLDINLYEEVRHPDFDVMIRKNQNARCLLAIEIENLNSKKHIMGSVVNAASLGRIGIGIAYCNSALRSFLRIVNYLSFLKRVGKNTYDTTNFLVLNIDQVNSLLKRH